MEQPILSFLTAYFSDLHIQCRLTDRKQLELADLDLGLRNSILMQEADAQKQAPFPFVQNTIYFIVDYYECNYSFFRLPDKSAFLFVGPFLWREFERSQILLLMNRLDIPAELFPQLQEYYHALPLIADKASMTALLRHVYQTLDADADVSVQTLHLKDLETRESFLEKHQFVVPEDPVLSMHLLEERYHIEDELLDAISHGNSARALSFMEALGNLRFVPRTEDALRNRKNLILTLNTLLRRKAYETGVHPFYIDAVSGNFARMHPIRGRNQRSHILHGSELLSARGTAKHEFVFRSDPPDSRHHRRLTDRGLKPETFCQRTVFEYKLSVHAVQKGSRHDADGLRQRQPHRIRQEVAAQYPPAGAGCCGSLRHPRRPLFHTALPPHHGHDAPRVETLKDRGMECGRHGFKKICICTVPDCQPAAGIRNRQTQYICKIHAHHIPCPGLLSFYLSLLS